MRAGLFFVVLLSAGCTQTGANETEETDGAHTPDQPPAEHQSIQWGLVSSTMQLVTSTVDPALCPSGWTRLHEEFAARGKGHLIPLQAAYVGAFASLYDFARSAAAARGAFGTVVPTLRVSLVWPCWDADPQWPSAMAQAVQTIQDAGWRVELSLLQHDSYPSALHSGDGFGLGGWAAQGAVEAFSAYAQRVVDRMSGIVPARTRVYLGNEPVSSLFSGYLDPDGKWPPGGKIAGKSLGKALRNMRDAFVLGAEILSRGGFEAAISVNVRPLLGNERAPSDSTLDMVRNYWLIDALVNGCVDNEFSGTCSGMIGTTVGVIGLTFYGTMTASAQTVEIADGRSMSVPVHNFEPDAVIFGRTLEDLYANYGVVTGVSEIGFSSGDMNRLNTWLHTYKAAVYRALPHEPLPFVQLHTLFKSAEFSSGEWFFHMAEGCDGTDPCRLTPWGEQFMEIASAP